MNETRIENSLKNNCVPNIYRRDGKKAYHGGYDPGMDGTTKAILWQVGTLGYTIETRTTDNAAELIATSKSTGERFIARDDTGDTYRAACRLAELVGIDLRDG